MPQGLILPSPRWMVRHRCSSPWPLTIKLSDGSVDLYSAWRKANIPVELHIFQTGRHGFTKKAAVLTIIWTGWKNGSGSMAGCRSLFFVMPRFPTPQVSNGPPSLGSDLPRARTLAGNAPNHEPGHKQGPSINRPDSRRCDFDEMPVWVSKIQAPAAQFPRLLLLHFNAVLRQPRLPSR
jgi:hypothetical protein